MDELEEQLESCLSCGGSGIIGIETCDSCRGSGLQTR
jgi:hypothetical protein